MSDALLEAVSRTALDPAFAVLPAHLDTKRARVQILTTGLQESRLKYRRQLDGGPARGLLQFEEGTRKSKGGVWGVYLHHHTHALVHELCRYRDVGFEPRAIWSALEHDDVLAMGLGRLLLLTDPHPLPEVDDAEAAWNLYAYRTWRPGKPHRETWDAFHEQARAYVVGP